MTEIVDERGNVKLEGMIQGDSEVYAAASSRQPIGVDFNVGAAVGKSTDTAYIAAGMFKILGAALTKTKNYIGGIVGALEVTGTNASTYPVGAVLAQVSDGVTIGDGAVVAYIDGDSAQTNIDAMFKVMCNNSTAASGPNFGLDLQDAAHDGFQPVDAAFYKSAPLRLVSDVVFLTGTGVPTNAVTGAGVAGPGSLYFRTTNGSGQAYVNTNTKASPTWAALS